MGQDQALRERWRKKSAIAKRHRPVDIGTGARGFGHEIFARNSSHPLEHPGIVDPAGAQLAFDHVTACGREICRFLRGGNHFSRLAIYAAW